MSREIASVPPGLSIPFAALKRLDHVAHYLTKSSVRRQTTYLLQREQLQTLTAFEEHFAGIQKCFRPLMTISKICFKKRAFSLRKGYSIPTPKNFTSLSEPLKSRHFLRAKCTLCVSLVNDLTIGKLSRNIRSPV